MCGCLLCAPPPGTRQPRHVPWLGIKPVTFWFIGPHSIHWATPARDVFCFSLNVDSVRMGHVFLLAKCGNFMLENQTPSCLYCNLQIQPSESLWEPSNSPLSQNLPQPPLSLRVKASVPSRPERSITPVHPPAPPTHTAHQPSPTLSLLLPSYCSSPLSGTSPAQVTQIHTQPLTPFSALPFSSPLFTI